MAANACELLKAMANEWRLMILCQLAEGRKTVSELQSLLGLSQSALSQHLAILRREKIVRSRKHAQSVSYSLTGDEATKVMESLHDVFAVQRPQRSNEMKSINRRALALLSAFGLTLLSGAAMATNGYFTHGVGTESKGMAGTGVGSNAASGPIIGRIESGARRIRRRRLGSRSGLVQPDAQL